jgi:hypothetical protein
MSFFDMYPMGGMNVGGMNVGGFPIGGALPPQYLSASARLRREENPEYIAMREKAQYTRDLKKESIDIRTQEIIAEGLSRGVKIPKSRAKVQATSDYNMANYEMKQSQKVSKPRTSRKDMPRAPLSSLAKMFQPYSKRLAVGPMRKKGSKFVGEDNVTADQLLALDAALSKMGLGMYNMETGGAWYDDLWSGVKDVASVAAPLLPLLL